MAWLLKKRVSYPIKIRIFYNEIVHVDPEGYAVVKNDLTKEFLVKKRREFEVVKRV